MLLQLLLAPFTTTEQPLVPTPRIVGGVQIDPAYKYPFLSSLLSYNSPICGASLIEPSWVLTAAHCVNSNRPASTYSVLIHGHDFNNLNNHRCTETISAVRSICHPSYNSNSMVADICLLQLQRPATCGAELRNRGALSHLDYDGSDLTPRGRP